MLVFTDGHAQSQLDRHAGLAFADPLGVRLEDREDLLFVGDALAIEDTAADLIAQELAIGDVLVKLGQQNRG